MNKLEEVFKLSESSPYFNYDINNHQLLYNDLKYINYRK